MQVTRRDFLKYCGASAAALGLSQQTLTALAAALNNPAAPSVLWLQGAGCTGCSVSFLNYFSNTAGAPSDAADLLLNYINLAYHPNLMAAAGETAITVAEQTYTAGSYILVVEGGVPTAFGGAPCWAWTDAGVDVTFLEAVQTLAARALVIICVGACASFGGIPASGANQAGIRSVQAATGKNTINIAGCPPHPDWIVWVVARLLAGQSIPLDSYGRPTGLFNESFKIHDRCPKKGTGEDTQFGQGHCVKKLGCRGPETWADCHLRKWNNGQNWCIGAGAPCIGCAHPNFPNQKKELFKYPAS